MAHALNKLGHTASVVDLSHRDAIADDGGVHVQRVRAPRFHWFASRIPLIGKTLALPIRELEYCWVVWRATRRIHHSSPIDVIEGTETGMLGIALLWRQCPLVIRLHGEQYTFQRFTPGTRITLGLRLTRALQRIALRRAKVLVSPSHAHAREIAGELDHSHPPMVVIPNSVSLSGVGPNGNGRNLKTVVYAGRIEKRKGVATFLRAAAQTRKTISDARFVIAGDFHSSFPETEFRKAVRACDLESSLDFLGPVSSKALADLYQHSAVAVLPSHYETFGLAALEPMVFGTPVIATDGSALPEVVTSDVNGKLVPSGSETALADAMTELLQDPSLCERMGRAATRHAANFDIEKIIGDNERLYGWCTNSSWSAADSHIFFSPHPDDVVLSCGGAIQSLISQDKHVQVVNVFGGKASKELSAFSAHLQAKWKSEGDAWAARRAEDVRALELLGVKDSAAWEYEEAAVRRSPNGNASYATYDELSGEPAPADQDLVDRITKDVANLSTASDDAVLYFPLSLGRHVDHQILFTVGCRLHAAGKHVRFYEDYPYAEKYNREPSVSNWLPRTVSIPLDAKLKATEAYQSQIHGLGGSLQNVRKRLTEFSSGNENSPSERYWKMTGNQTGNYGSSPIVSPPLTARQEALRLRDFSKFLQTFRWHDLDEVLAPGAGDCIDVGCGSARHKRLVESRGYRWVGFDRKRLSCSAQSDFTALPIATHSTSAVVAWQVLEYAERPDAIIGEASRVLEPGGLLCGSASFLEPVHGRTYFNLSPLSLESLLRRNGFGDIAIKPGLNGFALMLWTWLSRGGVPSLRRLAIPIAFLMLVPLAAVLFVVSWLSWRLGFGAGHFMRWISQTAPLEFAGHLIFSARKLARPEQCTSLS